MAHPRKFVEKIAIHTQRQQEETRAFEEIMKEVATIGNSMKGPQQQYRSLPNVNLNIGQNHLDLQKALNSLGEMQRHEMGDRSPMRERRFTGNRPMPFPRRNIGGVDTSPYHVAPPYLSPPQLEPGQGWRRAVSDSSLHQTVIGGHHQPKEIDINKMTHEPKRSHSPHARPKSVEVPSIGMYQADPGSPLGTLQQTVGSTGSLPDLTNLHIPSPLQTPIDTEDSHIQASSPPLYPTTQRQGNMRRHSPTMDKHPFPPQMQHPNLSPLEMRLQQVQLYQNSPNNDFNMYGQVTTSSPQNQSPTASTSMSPLFKNFPAAPMSPLEMNMKQMYIPNNSPVQHQHHDQYGMRLPGASIGASPRMQQQAMSSSQSPGPYGFPGFLQYYMQSNRVPDLIVTDANDESQKLDFARDLSSAMQGMGGDMYNNDDLRVELDPLDMESLQMLSGHGDAEVADQATEDQFRMDRLAGSYGFP
ncbi:CREB-regulated transcription coactivator 1 [Nematostella vectensis]|uniref:CREB-regulated transcription coactivator 1 n=1 Tax=Nematostella vectensis TaxID=45351 RepID=UPI002077990C|nr:CREB-regulated transcription coactivator 1 [Nematostella vectensis]